MAEKLNTEESTAYDALFSVNMQNSLVPVEIKVAKGTVLKRGTLVKLDETGNAVIVAANSDEVYGVVAKDIDGTDAATVGTAYVNGEFNASALTVTGTVTDYVAAARKAGIIIR